jgi:hypothetical protein
MSEYTCEYTTPENTSIIFTHATATQPQIKINVGDEYNFTYNRGGDARIKVTKIEPESDNPTKPGMIYYKTYVRGKVLPFSDKGLTFDPVFSETERNISVSKITGLKDGKINVIGGGGVSNRSKRSKKTKSKRGGRRSRCRSIKKYKKVRKSRRRRYMSS